MHYTTSCNTQSSAPEDGSNYRPKNVELIGIINKPLLLRLVGCLYYCLPFDLFNTVPKNKEEYCGTFLLMELYPSEQ